jgi:uncharacterized RDD family membrane protein YckC
MSESPANQDPAGFPPPPMQPVAQGTPINPPHTVAVAPIPGLVHNGVTWTCGGAPLTSNGKRLGSYLLEGVLIAVTLLFGWFVWSLFTWRNGQTPAKALLGMRCLKAESGTCATWGTMFLREIVGKGLIAIFTLGITTIISYFTILFGASRQSIWDKVAGTVVVDDPAKRLVQVR